MCLSNVYTVYRGEKKLVYANAATVQQKEDTLVFTNILGIPFEVKGTIRSVDLLENNIMIDVNEEEND